MTSRSFSVCKHTVSGSISLPSRGSFHHSLTVLFAIGHQVVFSLTRWSSHLHTGFHVSRATLDTARRLCNFGYGAITLYRTSFQKSSPITQFYHIAVLNPQQISSLGLGSCSFARHYSHNRLFTFFSSAYLVVSVQRVPLITLWIHVMILQHNLQCVSTFGNRRITDYVHLPVAYRSLSRPSSAPSAKASPICSLQLNHFKKMNWILSIFASLILDSCYSFTRRKLNYADIRITLKININ